MSVFRFRLLDDPVATPAMVGCPAYHGRLHMRHLTELLGAAFIGGCLVLSGGVWFIGMDGPAIGGAPATVVDRADYVDLLLTIVTVMLGATGLAVTVGAVAIGLVALKTLREIKDDAKSSAKQAAAEGVSKTLPEELRVALVDTPALTEALRIMAVKGELNDVMEIVAASVQGRGDEQVDAEVDDTDFDADVRGTR